MSASTPLPSAAETSNNPPAAGGTPVDRLNHLLCGEIAAETAYRLIADRIRQGGEGALYLGLLRQFQEEHELAAAAIQEQIREVGGETTDVSGSLGVWGDAARCATGFGGARRGDADHPSALECLRRGECHNLDDYQGQLGALDASSAQLLRNLLIPAQRRHVHVLDELMGEGAEG